MKILTEIIKLLKVANLNSFVIPVMEPIGCGYANNRNLDLFENMPFVGKVGETDIPYTMLNYFHAGIGIYKQRIRESLSMFYWLNVIVFLPILHWHVTLTNS